MSQSCCLWIRSITIPNLYDVFKIRATFMNLDYLDFEQPIADLVEKITELKRVGDSQDINLKEEIYRLEEKSRLLTEQVFSDLTPHQVVQLARHPKRPYTEDYLPLVFQDFQELEGDRHLSKGSAVVGGLARLGDKSVMVIGQQKGRGTKDKVAHNFGMSKPEDFRKALRLMKLAERFSVPVITIIDTPGAYPGIGAEERSQSEAIARNLQEMSILRVPIICCVIGEGCSGGALAIGVGDWTMMLEYSYYSVISPEGCASILWKSADKAPEAAQALNLTADRLLELGLIQEVLPEPLGGAHRDLDHMALVIQAALKRRLDELLAMSEDSLLEKRYQFWKSIGHGRG